MRLAVVSAFLVTAAAPTSAFAQPASALPVVFHVATVSGAATMSEDEADRWLEVANEHFAPAGITLARDELRPLPEGHAELENIRARRRLARLLVPRRINVFVVEEILDPHPSSATRRAASAQGFEPSGRLGGAHILVAGRVPETYILVRRRSGPLTLTHELGHFFSAPHHRDPENIMSYGRERHRFDAHQLRAFRHRARRYRRERALDVLSAPPSS